MANESIQRRDYTMDSASVDNRITSFRKSKWKTFDPEFAQMIKDKYPSIWALGGNIRGNDQYRKLYPITQRGGTANSDMEINALELREAWVARHYEDFRIAGVIAQIKWLAVGSRGEQYMKNLVRERIDNMQHSEMLLSDIESMQLDDVLAHFGIKGMRWGVRKDLSVGGAADLKWSAKTEAKFRRNQAKIFKKAFDAGFDERKALNDKQSWPMKEGSTQHKKYLREHASIVEKNLNKVIRDMGVDTGPSGGVRLRISQSAETGRTTLHFEKIDQNLLNELGHADMSMPPTGVYMELIADKDGRIIDYILKDGSLQQSSTLDVDDVLAHFGVKGMRWGVIKEARAARANKKAFAPTKKGPLAHLSDAELKTLVKRLEMEKKYKELTAPQKSKGKSIAKTILSRTASTVGDVAQAHFKTQLSNRIGAELTAKTAAKATAKAAAKAFKALPPPVLHP